MIIGICGYGATGSSAIVGLLKEYDEFNVCDNAEIQEAFKVDGLQDLEYHLVKQYSRHISGDAAIKRFIDGINAYRTPIVKKTIPQKKYVELSEKYVNNLIQGTWYGIDNFDYSKSKPMYNLIVILYKKTVFPIYEKITKKPYKHWPARKMYLCINPENFYEITQEYTNNLIDAVKTENDNKPVVFDQVFEGNAPQNCFPFFSDPKAIVVDRDPRDLWLVAKYAKRAPGEARFMPREDVRVFVDYYKKLRENQKRENSDRILFIQFEDAIYNYEETKRKIEAFLSCKNHINPKLYFNPEISINNTQLFNNPLYIANKKEIEYIEKELKQYLFDYTKYKKLKNFEKTF